MPPKDTLGNRVRVVRERLGITQVELAREVGISRQALISVEKGRMNPSVVVSLKIARILREPVDYLFFIDGRDGEATEPVATAAKAVVAVKVTPMVAPEPVAEASPVADEPHIILEADAEPEPEPYADDEPPEAVILEPEEAPEEEHARHAVPVSAESAADARQGSAEGDEPDDVQLSLFD